MKRSFCMIFWEVVFVMFILPWAYIPIVLGMWDENVPKWVRWVIKKANGE